MAARLVFDADATDPQLAMLHYEGESNVVRLHWTGDLNSDRIPDFIVYLPEYTGSHGHQYFVVCVGTSVDRFVVVWGPDYAQQLSVSDSPSVADGDWATLVWEDSDPVDKIPVVQRVLVYNGREYEFTD